MKKILSFGYDTERPYGFWAETNKGKDFRNKQLEFIKKLNKMLDSNNCPRTFFILGDYLFRCLDNFDKKTLREIYNSENLLIEIQQHSFSYQIFRNLGRDDKKHYLYLIFAKMFPMQIKF